MASAELVTLPPVDPPPEVVLTLSIEEAKIVAAGLGSFKFGTLTGPIYHALVNALRECNTTERDYYVSSDDYNYFVVKSDRRPF